MNNIQPQMSPARSRDTSQVLEAARLYIDRDYIGSLTKPENRALPLPPAPPSSIRMLQLDRLVYSSGDSCSGLMSVLHTLCSICNVVFLLICGQKDGARLYLGIQSEQNPSLGESALVSAMTGNFPGSQCRSLDASQCAEVLQSLSRLDGQTVSAAVSVSQLPSRREREDVQSLDRFMDAMAGKCYTAMILARPLSEEEVASRRNNLQNLCTSLSALEKLSYQFSENSGISMQKGLSQAITDSITDSISSGYSYGTSINCGTSSGSAPHIQAQFDTLGLGYSTQDSSFQSSGSSQGFSGQSAHAASRSTQTGVSVTAGASRGQGHSIQFTQVNRTISDLVHRIDDQLQRIRSSQSYALWESCAFFLAPGPDTALVAANIYKSLVSGGSKGDEKSYLNIWTDRNPSLVPLINSLKSGKIPLFRLQNGAVCSPCILTGGDELPLLMSLPRKSAAGVTVRKMAAFGREVRDSTPGTAAARRIDVGNICHMGVQEDRPVILDVERFSSHVLIAGATGVGKTTLTAMILNAMDNLGIKFMVVEPVKGEYKDLLGKLPGTQVFSTNPRKNRMLRLNPFAFPENIHVLSHIDHLMDVFSVCWPLYAAQPALLRECVEEAYIRSGWDLSNSVYMRPGAAVYPNFRLLLSIVPEVIRRSHFVGESKGTYEGALLTRIAMLSHGTYGQIFNSTACLTDQELFGQNVVADLSEVGSPETISLLMGLLVIRLREYRLSQSRPDQTSLRHVLVLEEAHNIFQRRTALNSEGGETVSGKSVQMLSQCVAEMRGYGQGIFIADQSPGEIDISGLRNTATKIIMRLTEQADLDSVAQSLSLTPDQSREIARLPKQVALIYQAGWDEPVLARIHRSTNACFAVNNDRISYETLKALRGRCIPPLLSMKARGTFLPELMQQAITEVPGITGSKCQDYIALFQAYRREYDSRPGGFRNAEDRIQFLSRLTMELLSCDDFFRLCPLPQPDPDSRQPYSTDPGFCTRCRRWKQDALLLLEQYVSGLTPQENQELLQLLLLSDLNNHRMISVHNALYDKMRR